MSDCQTETKYKVKEAAIKASEIMAEVGLKSGLNTLGKILRNIMLTLTSPLRRKLRMSWFVDVSKVISRSCSESDDFKAYSNE